MAYFHFELDFEVTVSRSVLSPRNQLTFPASLVPKLCLGDYQAVKFRVIVNPAPCYNVVFRRQQHRGGRWRSIDGWADIVGVHEIEVGDVLTFKKVLYPGHDYILRSTRIDSANRVRGYVARTSYLILSRWHPSDL